MFKRGLQAHDFFEQVVLERINALGVDVALKHNRVVVFYSGPDEGIAYALGAGVKPNWKLAEAQVTHLGASVIDNTDIAQLLTFIELRKYFTEVYPTAKEAYDAELEVWGKTSALFAACDFEEAATAICGASDKRVFRLYEQAVLVRNTHIKNINKRGIKLFKDFETLGAVETYRLMCLTELLEIRKHARVENTAEAWRDYRQRRKAFLIQFGDIKKTALPLTDAEQKELKQRKVNILALYKVAAIHTGLFGASAPVATAPYATASTGCGLT